MRFTQKVNEMTGAYCLYLDLEGLDISDLLPRGAGDLTKQESVDLIERFCYFATTSYDRLRPRASADVDADIQPIFNEVHEVFRRCTDDELKLIATLYLNSHYDILEQLVTRQDIENNLDRLTMTLSKRLYELDQSINLVAKIQSVVHDIVPIPAFDNVGERPQDSVDMTFVRVEVIELTVMVVLCKLMTPIFAVCIERIKKKIDTSLKEMHCARILLDILKSRFETITMKLQHFISRLVSQRIKDDLTYVFNGHTGPLVGHQIFSTLTTKRFVNVDLQQKDCNLMTYATKCIKKATDSSGSASSNHKTLVRPIRGPSEIHGDEGNISILEVESRRSHKTADQLGIITLSADMTIREWLATHGIPAEVFNEAVNHYSGHTIQVTPVNTYICGVLFGRYIGGAASIDLLHMPSLTSLIALSQFYLLKLGYTELVHLMTVSKSLRAKEVSTPIDNLIKSTYLSSFEYRNMNNRYAWSVVDLKNSTDIRWDTHLKTICEYITTVNHLQNTAPVLLSMMGGDVKANGTPWEYNDIIIRDICSLLENESGLQLVT